MQSEPFSSKRLARVFFASIRVITPSGVAWHSPSRLTRSSQFEYPSSSNSKIVRHLSVLPSQRPISPSKPNFLIHCLPIARLYTYIMGGITQLKIFLVHDRWQNRTSFTPIFFRNKHKTAAELSVAIDLNSIRCKGPTI